MTHKPDMSKVTELFAYLMEHFLDDVDRVMGQLEKELKVFGRTGLYICYCGMPRNSDNITPSYAAVPGSRK